MHITLEESGKQDTSPQLGKVLCYQKYDGMCPPTASPQNGIQLWYTSVHTQLEIKLEKKCFQVMFGMFNNIPVSNISEKSKEKQ